jgi:hypothetical protein
MTPGSGRPVRASDADREKVHSVLADAYAEGRLTWTEFDARSTALVKARTYDQLSELTVDLPGSTPAVPPPAYVPVSLVSERTSGTATASLVCALAAFPLTIFLAGIVPAIAAIILGHRARRRIRQTGEKGAGMAAAALTIGYLYAVLYALLIIGAVSG